MNIQKLSNTTQAQFKELFAAYYEELGCDEDIEHLLNEYVIADFNDGLLDIAVATNGEEVCGFIIWQIDTPKNEWCLKPGLGTVRELYVSPDSRQHGAGSSLLAFAEGKLRESGVQRAYVLPAEGTSGYFIFSGYAESDEFCGDMDCNFFYKLL